MVDGAKLENEDMHPLEGENGITRRTFLKNAAAGLAVGVGNELINGSSIGKVRAAANTLQGLVEPVSQELQPSLPEIRAVFLVSANEEEYFGQVVEPNSLQHDPNYQQLLDIQSNVVQTLQHNGINAPSMDMYVSATNRNGSVEMQATPSPTQPGTEELTVFATIDGTDRTGAIFSGGLVYSPLYGEGSPITSITSSMGRAAYGQEGFNGRTILPIPDPNTGNILGYEYRSNTQPLSLVTLGKPNAETSLIDWGSARREVVAGQEFIVSTNKENVTIDSINVSQMERLFELLSEIPPESGVFRQSAGGTRVEINHVSQAENPSPDELNPQRIMRNVYGHPEENETVILMQPITEEGTLVNQMHPTDKWLQGTNVEMHGTNNMSILLSLSYVKAIGFSNHLFGMDVRVPGDREEKALIQYLVDNGYNFLEPPITISLRE